MREREIKKKPNRDKEWYRMILRVGKNRKVKTYLVKIKKEKWKYLKWK